MRGELIGVWSETWREIWLPLSNHEGVSEDIFCEVYRTLASAIKIVSDDDALSLPSRDNIQLREAFELALRRGGVAITSEEAARAFGASGAALSNVALKRRNDAIVALVPFLGDDLRASEALEGVLSEVAYDPRKRMEASARAIDASVLSDVGMSKDNIQQLRSIDLIGERVLALTIEQMCPALYDFGGEELANRFFNLLEGFIEKFSLRYDLRRPCTLCPTLPGLFASLVRQLRVATTTDAHLDGLRKDFEDAIRDLRIDCSDVRMRSCIQKQVILLEALGQIYPGVTQNTLGAICGELSTWPHDKVQEAVKDLYRFTNSYPGIRHAGTLRTARRVIDMRDLVAMSIALAGFTPYLSDRVDADAVYRGA